MNEPKNQENIESNTSKFKTGIKIIVASILVGLVIFLYQSDFTKTIVEAKTINGNKELISEFPIDKIIINKGNYLNNIALKNELYEDTKKPVSNSLSIEESLNNTDSLLSEVQERITERIAQEEQAKKEELIKNSITKYVISDNGLNIRNLNMEVIKALPLNSEIMVLIEKANEEFDLVLYNNEYAYMSNTYLGLEKKVIKKVEKKTAQGNETVKASNNSSTSKGTYLGTFSTTAYCNCSICCGQWAGRPTASGVMPQAGRTIAVDPKVIPLGTKVIINGNVYVAEDTGSAIKGNKIDIYHSSHSSASQWGRRTMEVYLAS